MSDIFISYKREEQATARKLAIALESEGWTVWWDPKLRAGERFNDVIEKALKESNCVVVIWSKRSVESQYVKHEANYALRRNKLVPIVIEEVELPFRFEDLHTLSLLEWDGSKDFSEFRKLVQDIAAIVTPAMTETKRKADKEKGRNRAQQKTRAQLTAEKEHRRKQERQSSEEEVKPKADEARERLSKFRQRAISKPGAVLCDKLKDGSQGPEMVVIPAGTFKMGDIQGKGGYDEKPVHAVRIAKPFSIGRYPITFDEYDRFASAISRPAPNDQGWGRGRRPVINVTWEEAVEYTKWLSEQTDKRYRLPTEAEWEYAARAGTETTYWWDDEMKPGMANCKGGDSRWDGKQTSPVGSFPPNQLGLYDTAGNVFEWVQDGLHETYQGAPNDGSAWEAKSVGDRRVLRGGSWDNDAWGLRASLRGRTDPDYRSDKIGFRLARDLD
jgi:formylglycine-generating enzyme required for sulfatase activity